MTFYSKKTVHQNPLGCVLGLVVGLVMLAGVLRVVWMALKGGE